MTNPLGFDALQALLHRWLAQLPDHRKQGPNTRYAIRGAALGAFGIFFTQSPSFLEYQRHLQQAQGQNNAYTLSVLSNSPVTIRYATCLILCSRVSSMGYTLRSLSVLHTRAHWPTGGSFRTNCWWHSMVPSTIPPTRFIATTVSGVNSPMATPSPIIAPLPR